MIYSYPSSYAIGHKAIAEILLTPVIVEEKIDGSQFSFGVLDGELKCRSKGKQLIIDAPEQMFVKAVDTARKLEPLLVPEWTYRCEFLAKPKHNTLAYERVPAKYLILFDINTGLEEYITPAQKHAEAHRLGLECVPLLMDEGMISSPGIFYELLDTDSILGGTKIEGVVVKNYRLFTAEKKIAIGKYVSERFKEKHDADWRVRNPTGKDVTQKLIDQYRTEARWQKAIQHLDEAGQLDHSPRDIGLLIKEIPADILKECENEIKDTLFSHYWQQIRRGITAGFPEWYKQRLMESAFEEVSND